MFLKVSELWTPPLVWWLRLPVLLKNAFFYLHKSKENLWLKMWSRSRNLMNNFSSARLACVWSSYTVSVCRDKHAFFPFIRWSMTTFTTFFANCCLAGLLRHLRTLNRTVSTNAYNISWVLFVCIVERAVQHFPKRVIFLIG